MKESETRKLSKSYFDVLGICCSSEVVLVEKILKNLEGVTEVSVVVATKSVTVIHDSLLISPQQIVKALNQARLEASVRVKGEKNYQKKWPSPFAIGSGILLALSFIKYFWAPFQWLALVAVAVGVPPIVFRALAALRNLTLDINILVLIAVAGSIVLHDYWEAGTIVFLFTIAEWLESRASHKAVAAMSSLVNIVPPSAVFAESGEEVNVQEVKLNSILSVKAGETIPIDGVVVEGECDVDEKTLTGESFPVSKQKDSTVWAGTLNLNGYISVKTIALAEDCAVARMAKLVEDAQNNKSKTQRFIDKCAKYYTPAIVALSASLAIVPIALRVHNRKEWYRLALVTLVSACPCALVLSTPVAMCCALSKAATSGLLFKGAEYLETLAKIKVMAFDKTGTITRGEFVVTEFRSLIDGLSLNTLLYWVSSVESKSSHPMAAALVEYAQSNSAEQKPERVEHFQNFPGEGIYGRIDGMEIYVGNRKISSRAGCTSVPEIEYDSFQGKSIGYIFLGSSPAGLFTLSDVCRTGVKDAMKELKLMGIKTAMLTGDCYGAAKHVQEQLGGALDEFQAELLPENKATIIKGFQRDAPTAMIGDGLNDAPALAIADIGISMGISGSALAKETGHVILMTNDIGRIPKAARLARRVRRKIIENMVISISTKAAIVGLAIAGYPLVWAAVLADTGSCLLVILNSMLLLRGGTHTHGKKCCKSSASSHAHHHHENKPSCCKSANSPQLCFSDIESQKKCTRTSCSSELCVTQTVPSGLNSCRNNHCADSIENKGCHLQSNPQCCSLKSKSFGHKNCLDSIHKNSCHSGMNSPKMSSSQCHSVTSSSSSCGNVKCSDESSSHSHADHQTCMSKMCDLKSQSSTSCSRTCGNTKFSDTTTNDSRHSHTNSESCCSNLSAPAYQATITGSRSCGNNSCPGSPNEHGSHSHTNPVYEEKLLEQERLDLVREDIESNDDHSHACPAEEHHHSKSDEAYSSCALEECCYSVQCHRADLSEPGSQETAHCHSTDQRCSPEMSVLGCQSAISASKSCGYSKCSDVVDTNSCHAHTDPQTGLTEVCAPLCKSSSRSCGNTKFSNSVSNNDHRSGSTKCRNNKSTDSINAHGCHSHANPLHDEDDLVQESSGVVGQDVISHRAVGHACSNKEEHAKLVRKYCKHRPCHEVRSVCRKHAAECGPAVRSTINILRDDHHHHHLDCSGRKVCSPLKKQRRVGGCCKSFRKECCAKNNHLAASLGGGLSEIVIE